VAVHFEDIPHPTEGIAVDIFSGSVVAVADPARSRTGVAHIDYSAMEFHCSRVVRGSPHAVPHTGDPYTQFALRVGAVPPNATKEQIEVIRDRYKVLLLATQYGMMTETLAARLGCSTFEAHELLHQHHALFTVYWRWSDDWVAHSLDTESHVHCFRLDVPDRNYRVQHAFDSELAGPKRRQRNSAGRLHPGSPPRYQVGRPGT
jgi:hypothetical protein